MNRETFSLETMRTIAARFEIAGQVVEAAPYGSGHINDTYEVAYEGAPRPRYLFQRVNHDIFRDVPALMENLCRVTEHLRSKLAQQAGSDPEREALTVIPARDGASCVKTDDGKFWRAYIFIEGAQTYDVLEDNGQAEAAARAFAGFQRALADLPPPPLHETIPDFHNTPQRYRNLRAAVEADPHNRARECAAEIDAYLRAEELACRVTWAVETGDLPTRVTHNDTKINNVMLDDETGAGICVIDLDTVMPGSVLFDFGDQIRSGVGHHLENTRDLGEVFVDLERFDSLARGYVGAARDFLTPDELDLLAFSGQVLALEIGARFLTDFLEGDVYFRISRPGENLDRARVQVTLFERLREAEDAMNAIVARYRA